MPESEGDVTSELVDVSTEVSDPEAALLVAAAGLSVEIVVSLEVSADAAELSAVDSDDSEAVVVSADVSVAEFSAVEADVSAGAELSADVSESELEAVAVSDVFSVVEPALSSVAAAVSA